MADDEPLDDARQVAMAAAAAAARVVETVAREARDQAAQHRATLERAQDQRRAQQVLAGLSTVYDSPDQRQTRDQAREAAGVPVDARQVRATADLMNGTDPGNAAAHGQPKQAASETRPMARTRTRGASRGR